MHTKQQKPSPIAVFNGKLHMSNCSQKSNKLIKLQTHQTKEKDVRRKEKDKCATQRKRAVIGKGERGINNEIMNEWIAFDNW